jgi:hypothetical protein
MNDILLNLTSPNFLMANMKGKRGLNSNKRRISTVFILFHKMTANHTITPIKTTDSPILSNRLIQFDN